MRAFAIRRGEKHGELAGRILCQDVRGVFRKGHVLRPEDVPVLIDATWTELLAAIPIDSGRQRLLLSADQASLDQLAAELNERRSLEGPT